MNKAKVYDMPLSTTFTPEQALHSMLKDEPADVLILAYDDTGKLLIRSSRLTRAQALFMLEQAKLHAFNLMEV